MTYGANLVLESPHGRTPMSLQTGMVLRGRYQIVRTIKSGGMGSVCEAVDCNLAGSPCAIKEILDSALAGPDSEYVLATFENEMKALVGLDHPGIPKVRDFFQEGDKRYIVMDFVQGRALDDEIRDSVEQTGMGLPPGKVVGDVLSLLEIIQYLHQLNPPILHRDIKPANILRDSKTGRIKLVDFGLAKAFNETLTPQTMVGTMGYCPPEQLSGKAEKRSDIYAIGATLYHMLTGKAPQLTFDPLVLDMPHLRPGLDMIVARATSVKASDRYASAKDMAYELRSWQASNAGSTSTASSVGVDLRVQSPVASSVGGPSGLNSAVQPAADGTNQANWAAVAGLALGVGILVGTVNGSRQPVQTASPAALASTTPAATPSALATAGEAPSATPRSPSSTNPTPVQKPQPVSSPIVRRTPRPNGPVQNILHQGIRSHPPRFGRTPSVDGGSDSVPQARYSPGQRLVTRPSPAPTVSEPPPVAHAPTVAPSNGDYRRTANGWERKYGNYTEVITTKHVDIPGPEVRKRPGSFERFREPNRGNPMLTDLLTPLLQRAHWNDPWEYNPNVRAKDVNLGPNAHLLPMKGERIEGYIIFNHQTKIAVKSIVTPRPSSFHDFDWAGSVEKARQLMGE